MNIEEAHSKPTPKVRWFLVWAGFFVYICPLTLFVFAFMKPYRTVPHWMFALNFSLLWTYMAWSNNKKERIVARTASGKKASGQKWSKEKFWGVMFALILAAGILGRAIVGRPDWRMIIVSAIAIPSGPFAGNVLVKRSNLVSPAPDAENANVADGV